MKKVKKETYTVKNVYDIIGESTHRTVEAALKAAKKREGEGWTVYGSDGSIWTSDFDQKPIRLL